jgi:hypothetical protein
VAQEFETKNSRRDRFVWDEILLRVTGGQRRELLTELANLRGDKDAVARFWKRWERAFKLFRPEEQELMRLRDQLRSIWRKAPQHHANGVLNEWLYWRPTEQQLAVHRDTTVGLPDHAIYSPFTCSIERLGLVPDNQNLRAMLIQGIFENYRWLKCCVSPKCASPFYFAKRRDQILCDAEPCKAERQRAHARKWWNENRSTKTQMKAKAATKKTKKGSGENVTRKAR